ncbi:MAG: hypothetical protein ACREJO_01935 [Phycisphaerales bacterium]
MDLICYGIGGLIVLSGLSALWAASSGMAPAALKKRTGMATPNGARVLGIVQIAIGAAMIGFAAIVLPRL